MNDKVWHPFRDGIDPILEFASKVVRARMDSDCAVDQSRRLVRMANAVILSGFPGRLETLRVWLQCNSQSEAANEINTKCRAFVQSLQKWETQVRETLDAGRELYSEDWAEIVDESGYLVTYLQLVKSSLRRQVAAIESARPGSIGGNGNGNGNGKRRGAPVQYDPKRDAQIAAGWASGEYTTYAECGKAFGASGEDVKNAIDRHRKRHPE